MGLKKGKHMRTLTEAEINDLINYLQGTCMSLDEALMQLFDIDYMSDIENEMEVCQTIDNAIFLCYQCGWWCEAGDWITDESPNYVEGEEICSQCGEYA
jgi:hypothetical protein